MTISKGHKSSSPHTFLGKGKKKESAVVLSKPYKLTKQPMCPSLQLICSHCVSRAYKGG